MDRKNTYTRRFLWSRLFVAAVVIAISFSCNKEEKRKGARLEEFIQREECGLFGHGGFLFRYDEVNCQFSINPARRQVRMQSDSQEDYVNIQFSEFPSPDRTEVEVVLKYKVGNEDKFWLWDGVNSLGLTTRCSPERCE